MLWLLPAHISMFWYVHLSAYFKIAQLKSEKNDLEQEKADILKGNGDSSQQLITLNDHLREKDKYVLFYEGFNYMR